MDNLFLWETLLSKSITSVEDLPAELHVNREMLEPVVERYPMRINPYYLGLIKHKDDPIFLQSVPRVEEMTLEQGQVDPLKEEESSPVPGLTHRYPDRVLFLISSRCAMYCRFCNRKRKVGRASMVTGESIREGISYIKGHPEIRDVLLSGGDPFLLSDRELHGILAEIRAIAHVQIIRIGTRVPCTLPQRVTSELVALLGGFHPLYINTHFNHPREITPEASFACNLLANGGIPLNCQTVLLKGVNDNPETMKELMQKLLMIRVRPYYLFQADPARGTAHFWTPLKKGIEIMRALQGHTSGLCMPHFAVDLLGGGGKIPLLPEYVMQVDGDTIRARNYLGMEYLHPVCER